MVDSFLPAMRGLVARKLKDDGLSQGRIAMLLGVTQPSVSLYFSQPRTKPLRALRELGLSEEDSETFASLLAEDLKKNPLYAVSTLYSLWSGMLGRGALCGAHRQAVPSLSECDMCMKTFAARGAVEDAVDNVSSAVRRIEGSSIFVRVMPEISVNIAYASGTARSVDDVVAVPGRIVKVRGAPRSFMRPEFGASTHLARILLEVRSHNEDVRASMNLRFDARMSKVLEKLGLKRLTIGDTYPTGAEDKVLEAIRSKVEHLHGTFDVIVDLGGPGIEPSLYVFAEDAVRVAQLGMRMAREYINMA